MTNNPTPQDLSLPSTPIRDIEPREPPIDPSEAFLFLGMKFQPLELSHRRLLEPILARHPMPLTGFTFNALACWSGTFRYAFHLDDAARQLIIALRAPDADEIHLLQPIGEITEQATEALMERSHALSYPLRIFGVGQEFLDRHPHLIAKCAVEESRDSANYIYASDDLADLKGKKFSKKRNLIAQARNLYAWQADDLRPEDITACQSLMRRIAEEDQPIRDASWTREFQALTFALEHFSELSQRGTVIRIGGKIEAFSLWEIISPTMAIVHFERARRAFKGLYQVVNQETAVRIRNLGIPHINREEDVGNLGLRQAKLSYHPLRLQPSLELTLQGHLSFMSY